MKPWELIVDDWRERRKPLEPAQEPEAHPFTGTLPRWDERYSMHDAGLKLEEWLREQTRTVV